MTNQDSPDPQDFDATDAPESEAETQSPTDTEAAVDATDATSEEKSVQQELAERTEDLQRVTAEYANFRKRTLRDREQSVAQAKAKTIAHMLPVLDDLDLADQHGDMTGALKSITGKINDVFTKLGVTAFAEPGDDFNPEIHEAVQDLSEGEHKVIGQVLRRGYFLNEKLLRTAMVIIADPEAD